MKKLVLALVVVALMNVSAFAADTIKLPNPEKTGGIGVLDAVAARQSAGDFVDIELTPEQLSTLLWVAGGINRDNGKLTYPTAEGDHRALSGTPRQAFVAKAAVDLLAVDLLYVQDTGKWPEGRPADIVLNCGFAHAGLSMQNVYLYAASHGWGARTRMNFDRIGRYSKHEEIFSCNDCVHDSDLRNC